LKKLVPLAATSLVGEMLDRKIACKKKLSFKTELLIYFVV